MYWQHGDRSGSDGNDAGGASACFCGDHNHDHPHHADARPVLFVRFLLPGFDAPQPAGDYRVDQDEELIEAFSRLAWRRVGAFIHLPAIGMQWTDTADGADDPCGPRCRARKGPRTIMTAPITRRRSARLSRRDASTHLFDGRTGCPPAGQPWHVSKDRGDLPHHWHAPAAGKFTAVSHPQRGGTSRTGDDAGRS